MFLKFRHPLVWFERKAEQKVWTAFIFTKRKYGRENDEKCIKLGLYIYIYKTSKLFCVYK